MHPGGTDHHWCSPALNCRCSLAMMFHCFFATKHYCLGKIVRRKHYSLEKMQRRIQSDMCWGIPYPDSSTSNRNRGSKAVSVRKRTMVLSRMRLRHYSKQYFPQWRGIRSNLW